MRCEQRMSLNQHRHVWRREQAHAPRTRPSTFPTAPLVLRYYPPPAAPALRKHAAPRFGMSRPSATFYAGCSRSGEFAAVTARRRER